MKTYKCIVLSGWSRQENAALSIPQVMVGNKLCKCVCVITFYVCVCVCMCVCAYVYFCVCIHIRIHVHVRVISHFPTVYEAANPRVDRGK